MIHLFFPVGNVAELIACRISDERPNGWRYPLVGGTRERRFDGTNLKPRKLPENAPTPTSRVHAVLASLAIACS